MHVIELRSSLSCWDLLVGIQGCNRFASVVGSVRVCTVMEGAASSKFGRANVNDRLKILDTILIYLFLTLFLPMHSMHCSTPCTHHASPTVPTAGPMHVSLVYLHYFIVWLTLVCCNLHCIDWCILQLALYPWHA